MFRCRELHMFLPNHRFSSKKNFAFLEEKVPFFRLYVIMKKSAKGEINMKKWLCLLLVLSLLPLSALAGNWVYGAVLQSEDGYITLYEDKGKNAIATLYSGVTVEYDSREQQGAKDYLFVYVLGLTDTLSGYVSVSHVQDSYKSVQQQDGTTYTSKQEFDIQLEKAVLLEDAALYDSYAESAEQTGFLPKHFQVWLLGEMKDRYFVQIANTQSTGFMDKAAVQKTGERGDPSIIASPVAVARVYAEGQPGQKLAPMYQTCDKTNARTLVKNGTEMNIYQYNDQWALAYPTSYVWISRPCFIERRFLEETWDHTLPVKYVVTSSASNRLLVRPSIDSEDYTCKLYPGACVPVIAEKGEWSTIILDGNMYYVKKEFLSDTPVQTGLTATLYKPYLAEGLMDTGTFDMLACREEMVLLRIPERGDVWVPLDFVTAGEDMTITATITSGSLKMRAAPNQESSVITTVSKGKKVDVLILGDVWSLVEYKGETGYMMTRYLQH